MPPPAMSPDSIDPTPASRRKLLLLIVAVTAGAALLKFVLMPRLLGHIQTLPLCERLRWLQALLIGLLASTAVAGVHFAWYARRVSRAGQWPLPDAWVWRRTPVRRGSAVRWRVRGMMACAIVAMAMPWVGWQLLSSTPLMTPPPSCQRSHGA